MTQTVETVGDVPKPAPLACRIHEDIIPRDTVLEVLQGMDEWYNGFAFLWNHGGWSSYATIPAEYHDTFRVATERAERMKALGKHGEATNYVETACIMQAARWFTGHDQSRERQVLYNATARVLALSLGWEDTTFSEDRWSNFEGHVITYNDQPGRTFAGIRDLIGAAIYRARSSGDVNVSLDRAKELLSRPDDDD